MKNYLLFMMLFLPLCLKGQIFLKGIGSSGIFSYRKNEPEILFSVAHPASSAETKSLKLGIRGGVPYGLTPLSFFEISSVFPFANGGFNISFSQAGDGNFGELEGGLAYGRELGNNLKAGIHFGATSLNARGYESYNTINAGWGLIVELVSGLNAAFIMKKHISLNDKFTVLPDRYTLGLGYEFSEELFIGIDLARNSGQLMELATAIAYRVITQLEVQAGMEAANGEFWLAAAYKLGSWQLHAATRYHPSLLLSPVLTFSKNFSEKADKSE